MPAPRRRCSLSDFRACDRATWHRRDHMPRPVVVWSLLAQKVRVVDLVASTRHRLVLHDVTPGNLTVARDVGDRRLVSAP